MSLAENKKTAKVIAAGLIVDALGFAGAALMTYGFYLVYDPAAYIFSGAVVVWVCRRISR